MTLREKNIIKKELITKIKGKAFLRLSMYSILKKVYNWKTNQFTKTLPGY